MSANPIGCGSVAGRAIGRWPYRRLQPISHRQFGFGDGPSIGAAPKSVSITGGVGPLYYSTYNGRRRATHTHGSPMGCLAILAVVFFVVPAAFLIGVSLALYLLAWLLFAVCYLIIYVIASAINGWSISRGRPAKWVPPSYRELALNRWARRIPQTAEVTGRMFSRATGPSCAVSSFGRQQDGAALGEQPPLWPITPRRSPT